MSSVAANYRLRFLGSVFLCLREDLKGKSGQLRDFCLPVSSLYFHIFSFHFFLFLKTGPDEQLCVAFTFIPHNIWKKILPWGVYIFFEDRRRKANDNVPFSLLVTIIQSFTTNINVNTATCNFFFVKKKTDSGSRSRRVCRYNRRELFHILDKLTFSARI